MSSDHDATGSPLFALPEELLEFKQSIRRFVDAHVIPFEPQGALPAEQREKVRGLARDLGLWAVNVPIEYGGTGLGAVGYVVVAEEISRTVLWEELYWLGFVIGAVLKGSPEQIERYVIPTVRGERFGCFAFTESTGGSDPGRNIHTTARRDGDRWVLNGRKCFISNGETADYAVVVAITDDVKRQHGGMTAFLVDRDTPGFNLVRVIPTMGDIHPTELEFNDVVVTEDQILGDVGEGFVLAQKTLSGARTFIGAHAVGQGSRLLDLAMAYMPTREMFGQPLHNHGQAQAMLADCAIDIETCRLLTYRTAAEADRGNDTRILDSMVKVHASEVIHRVTDRVLQLHGGWGLTRDFPIERMYRDSRMWRIVDGPNEVHRMLICRELIRRQSAQSSR